MTPEHIANVTKNLPWNFRSLKQGEYFPCKNCKTNKVYRRPSDLLNKTNVYCSMECSRLSPKRRIAISNAHLGKVVSEETKNKLRTYTGSKTSNWNGGKPKCPDCNKQIAYSSKYCQKCKVKHRSKKHMQRISKTMSKVMSGRIPANNNRAGKFLNIKRGWFDINGVSLFFRSTWEANYARYLDFLIKANNIKKWEYEADIFIFEKIKFGTRTYRPDFKVFNLDDTFEYHEVKGWVTPRSKTQLNRMRIYYPKVKLVLIGKKEYSELKNKIGALCGFEK